MTTVVPRKVFRGIVAATRRKQGKRGSEMTGPNLPLPQGAPQPGPPPRKPYPPRERRTPHGLHLALVIVLGVLTFWAFFLLGWVWLCVWLVHGLVNDHMRRGEQRDYVWAMGRYRQEVIVWQLRCKDFMGWVPQLPE